MALYLVILLAIIILIISTTSFVSPIYIVKQAEAIIIERFGKYSRTLTPGIHFVIPFIDKHRYVSWTETDIRKQRTIKHAYRIDLRETVDDFPKQNVITKDNVNIEINALLYYQIFDPKSAVYEIENVTEAIEKLTQTTLRNVIGSMELDETLVSRDSINAKLTITLDKATDKWGIKVNRVELQEVVPPLEIRHAMEKQMKAERTRRAIIIESEGKKSAAILQAEGDRDANILRANGIAQALVIDANAQAESKLKLAQAEAQTVDMLKTNNSGTDALTYLTTIKYIHALEKMMGGKDNKFIVVPYESSGLTGSLSIIKKLFEENNITENKVQEINTEIK